MLIDTHAHLTMEQFDEDRQDVISRSLEAGLAFTITIGVDPPSNILAAALAEAHESIYFSPGFHPHDVKTITDEDYRALTALLGRTKAVAVGETGLDYHYDLSPRNIQRENFARQINLAKDVGKPLIIHSREANLETIEIMKSAGARDAGGTMHCFAGDQPMADAALDMGFFISVGGTLTFKNADPLRDIIARVPIERILLETDCPYLAPIPMRGKRNEPAYVKLVAERLAQIKGLSVEDVARITSLNAMSLFKMGEIPSSGEIAYPIRDSLYLNITNRCTNECTFCVRNTTDFVKGHNLRLKREPEVSEILAAMGDFEKYREVVFCGYGEPFMRLDVIKEVSKAVHARGIKVRVNTNGHALMIHNRNVIPEIAGLVDSLSVSLNFPDSPMYEEVCKPVFGDEAYASLKQFVIDAKKLIPDVTVTVLEMPGVDVAECRRIAKEELGVNIRVRQFNVVG